MRLFTLAESLNEWRDRAGTPIGDGGTTTLVQGAAQVAFSYTCPANRSALINHVWMRITPIATIIDGGFLSGYITLIPSGGSGETVQEMMLSTQEGPGTFVLPPTNPIQMYAGDQFRMMRWGGGPAPNAEWAMGYYGVEYDA